MVVGGAAPNIPAAGATAGLAPNNDGGVAAGAGAAATGAPKRPREGFLPPPSVVPSASRFPNNPAPPAAGGAPNSEVEGGAVAGVVVAGFPNPPKEVGGAAAGVEEVGGAPKANVVGLVAGAAKESGAAGVPSGVVVAPNENPVVGAGAGVGAGVPNVGGLTEGVAIADLENNGVEAGVPNNAPVGAGAGAPNVGAAGAPNKPVEVAGGAA